MDFTFSEDQELFQTTVRDFLLREVTPEFIRRGWDTDSGRDDGLWKQLAELGLTGMTVPEEQGGLGMSELDFVLLAQECGYVALPEPLVHVVLVAVPLLRELGGELAAEWLPKIAAGEARIAVGLDQNLVVEDAHVADLVLLERGGALYALQPGEMTLAWNESVDPSRRLFSVTPADEIRPLLTGKDVDKLAAHALNRGALACAAQALGLTRRMVDLSVQYAGERKQFGKPIGSFQAVKHHMADVAVQLEYARAPVHRAAYAVANRQAQASTAVSHAKLAAGRASKLAAKHSIQVHGAMGYTWEVDLHIFMKRAWALANSWGDEAFHKQRIAESILADGAALGAGATFA